MCELQLLAVYSSRVIQLGLFTCSEGQWARRTSADLPHPPRQTLRPAAAVEVAQGALSLSLQDLHQT